MIPSQWAKKAKPEVEKAVVKKRGRPKKKVIKDEPQVDPDPTPEPEASPEALDSL